jgi:hypothetical protein
VKLLSFVALICLTNSAFAASFNCEAFLQDATGTRRIFSQAIQSQDSKQYEANEFQISNDIGIKTYSAGEHLYFYVINAKTEQLIDLRQANSLGKNIVSGIYVGSRNPDKLYYVTCH